MPSVSKTVLLCSTKTTTLHGRLVSSDMQGVDQAIQTILLGLPEDVYADVDSCETAKEIWKRVRQMMKGSDIEEQRRRQSSSMNGKIHFY
nr:ribonuclease H-like domain-containing protein [Tanacetum cinerariifolium]